MIANRQATKRLEKKYHLVGSSQDIDYSGSVFALSTITQGDTDLTRDGDSLYLRSINLKGCCQLDVLATSAIVRIMVVQWFDDSTPAVSDILSGSYLGTVNAPSSSYFHDQRNKFRVLYDRRVLLNDGNTECQIFDTKYLKPSKRKIHFTAGTTTGSNKLWLVAVSDSISNLPTMNYVSRITFNDA